MDQKIVDQKRLSQVKGSYAEGSVLNYATNHKNDLAMKEKILKNFKIVIFGIRDDFFKFCERYSLFGSM